MNASYDAIVVGGGYFGCAAAYYLAKAGQRTLLVEKKEVSSGASGANFGNVQVQDASMGLSYTLTLEGFAKMQTMEAELGCSIGYNAQPSLIAAEKEDHLEELERLYKEKKEAGLDIRWLNRAQLAELEPNLNPEAVVAATYFEQGRVYPFHYLYALLGKGKEYGLEVREFTEVESLLIEGGACTGLCLQNGETLRATHVVVAAGSGTRPLCATAGLDVPVLSVKAESFVSEAIQPFMRSYYSSAAFFAEAHDQEKAATSLCIGQSHYGNLLLAETAKPHHLVAEAWQDATSLEHCRNIRAKLAHFFPCLGDLQILRGWATASPFTPNNEPVFGKSPVPGLLLAAGFKSAVVMSAVAGEIIAGLATKDHSPHNLSCFMQEVKKI